MNFSTLTELISNRLIIGFSTLPSFTEIVLAIILIFSYALIALYFGFILKFFEFELQFSRKVAIKIITTSLIAPAILEELFFRVLLLPSSQENIGLNDLFFQSIISLFLFIIYHPLNAMIFFPAGRKTFFDPVFLSLAALLGLVCTITYLQSGSIWLPVFIHWLMVIIWLLCLGGLKKLKFHESII